VTRRLEPVNDVSEQAGDHQIISNSWGLTNIKLFKTFYASCQIAKRILKLLHNSIFHIHNTSAVKLTYLSVMGGLT